MMAFVFWTSVTGLARQTESHTRISPYKLSRVCDLIPFYTEGAKFPSVQDVLAIIQVESTFRPSVVNSQSVGLMMVSSKSPRERRRLKEPIYNVSQGVALLKQYYSILGSPRAAVEAYNIGIGSYQRHQLKISGKKYWVKFIRAKRFIKNEEICNED